MMVIYQAALIELTDIISGKVLCIPLKDVREVIIGGTDEHSTINGIRVDKSDAEIMRKIFLGIVPYKTYAVSPNKENIKGSEIL